MIFHEKFCDRLCLLDFNEWNCIIFIYGIIVIILLIIFISEELPGKMLANNDIAVLSFSHMINLSFLFP